MTKKILISLSVIGIVAAIVVGGTYAWFSSEKTSTGNTFGSGTMNFRIARPGDIGEAIFNVSNLKPGQIVEGYLAVVNDSTEGLDMKWKAYIPSFSDGILDDVLEVRITMNPAGFSEYVAFENAGYTVAGPGYASGVGSGTASAWISIQSLVANSGILAWDHGCTEATTGNEPFRVKWAGIYKIEVKMLETADNGYQGQSFTGNINFYATQCEATL